MTTRRNFGLSAVDAARLGGETVADKQERLDAERRAAERGEVGVLKTLVLYSLLPLLVIAALAVIALYVGGVIG